MFDRLEMAKGCEEIVEDVIFRIFKNMGEVIAFI